MNRYAVKQINKTNGEHYSVVYAHNKYAYIHIYIRNTY